MENGLLYGGFIHLLVRLTTGPKPFPKRALHIVRWRIAVNKLNKQPRTTDEGWSSSLGVGEVLTPLRKKVC
jgi:hypothetical protein